METRSYDFHKLHSETEFEELVALIARKLIGHMITFKQGADEGRDARFEGKAADWPNENGLEGKFVLQAKHTRSETANFSANDFRRLVRDEHEKIRSLVKDGDCDYYLFFTTKKLPGPIDRELIREIEALGVKKADILAAETLKRLVDNHPEIQNWIYERTDGSRARSTQRWGKLLGLLREQDARTRNIVGFMNEAFVEASRLTEDLIVPSFHIVEAVSEPTREQFDLADLSERLETTTNHFLIEGPVGAGKSVAAKMLVQRRMPADGKLVGAYDQHNHWLPLYVTGDEIHRSWDSFVGLLGRATAETDHRNWCVIVDGFDEIESSDLRKRLINYAFSTINPKNAVLRFVFFSRPDTLQISDGQPLTRLKILDFDRVRQLQAALLFSKDSTEAEKLLTSLESSLDKEVLSRPLFLALAIYLGATGHGDINSRFELVDFFLDDVLKRAEEKSGQVEADLRAELAKLAIGPASSQLPEFPRGAAAINAANERQRVLSATGVVELRGASTQFTHQIFLHYFKAKHLAAHYKPNSKIWEEIDPFDLGWETVSLLCECWDANGECVSSCLTSLARLSGEGFERAVELASVCRNVSDQTRYNFARQIMSDYNDSGVVSVTVQTLSRLAEGSELTREHLIDVAESGSGENFDGRVLAARCVASFDIGMSVDLLGEIATSEDVYWDDRLSAANELDELGACQEALDTLRDISFDGDEFQGRFEAAVSALEMTGNDRDRVRLSEVIAEHKPEEDAYDDTLGRASVLGFSEFAAPLIRAPIEKLLSSAPKEKTAYHLRIDSALWSCETLAKIGYDEDALNYYERLLALEDLGSRNIADILSSMSKAGFRDQVERLLHKSETLERLRIEPDWFTAELLAKFGLSRFSIEDTLASFQASVLKRTKLHDCLHHAERLISEGRRKDVLEVIRALPLQKLMPGHFEILARCGEREAVKESLSKGVRVWRAQEHIWSAKVLERIGYVEAAIEKLVKLAQSTDLSVEDRLDAALEVYEIDERKFSAIEDCMQHA